MRKWKWKKGKIASFPRIIRTHFDFAAFAGSLPLSTSTSCRPLHLRRTSWKREWVNSQKRTRGCPISLKRWSFHFETLEFLLQAKFWYDYNFRMQSRLRIPFWWLIASPALVMYCPKRSFPWRRKWQLRSLRMQRNRPYKPMCIESCPFSIITYIHYNQLSAISGIQPLIFCGAINIYRGVVFC